MFMLTKKNIKYCNIFIIHTNKISLKALRVKKGLQFLPFWFYQGQGGVTILLLHKGFDLDSGKSANGLDHLDHLDQV